MRFVLVTLGIMLAILAVTLPMAVRQAKKAAEADINQQFHKTDDMLLRDIEVMEQKGFYTGALRHDCLGYMDEVKLDLCKQAIDQAMRDIKAGHRAFQRVPETEN